MAEASERLYRVEYAKSGRASCKKCSESIPKDSLRMAIMVQVRRGRAGGAGRRGLGGCVGSGPPHSALRLSGTGREGRERPAALPPRSLRPAGPTPSGTLRLPCKKSPGSKSIWRKCLWLCKDKGPASSLGLDGRRVFVYFTAFSASGWRVCARSLKLL